MKIVGVSGGIGSGKSTFIEMLHELGGFPVVDADLLSREAAAEEGVLREITEKFGTDAVHNNNLNRKYIADIVFSDQNKRDELNRIIHPVVMRKFEDLAKNYLESGHALILFDCPLLYEAHVENSVDIALLVYAPLEIRAARLMERDNMSEAEIKRRIDSQMPLEEKIARADIVVYNNGSKEDLRNAARQVVNSFYETIGR